MTQKAKLIGKVLLERRNRGLRAVMYQSMAVRNWRGDTERWGREEEIWDWFGDEWMEVSNRLTDYAWHYINEARDVKIDFIYERVWEVVDLSQPRPAPTPPTPPTQEDIARATQEQITRVLFDPINTHEENGPDVWLTTHNPGWTARLTEADVIAGPAPRLTRPARVSRVPRAPEARYVYGVDITRNIDTPDVAMRSNDAQSFADVIRDQLNTSVTRRSEECEERDPF